MKVEIDTRTFVRFWLIIAGLAAGAFLVFQAREGLYIILAALFLALALNAPVSLIAKKLPGKSRVAATGLSYLAVLVILTSVIFLVIPPIVQQTAKFAQSIPSVVDEVTTQWQGLDELVETYNLRTQLDEMLDSVGKSAGAWAGDVGKNVIDGVGSIFAFVTAAILVLVLTFLMLIEGPRWLNKIWSVYIDKDKMKAHRSIVTKMYKTVNGYVTGQLTVSTIGAIAAALFVFALSFVFPDVLANLAMPALAVTFVFSLIPMFGATIAGVLIMLLLSFNSVPAAITFIVFFIVYQQIENNFISPHIQAKRIALSPLLVLVAVTIGLYMFGVIGGIIAIPIAGCVRILIIEFLEHRKNRSTKAKVKLA